MGILIIITGLTIEILGWRLHQQLIEFSGLIVGLVIGDFVSSQILRLNFFFLYISILIISGIAFTVIFFVYQRISISIVSGLVGALIVSGFTSSRTLSEWVLNYPIFQTNFNLPVLIISFMVSSFIGYRFSKLGYIWLSSGIGSILLAYGGYVSNFWAYSNLGLFLLLSLLVGVIAQLSREGGIRERSQLLSTFLFCPNCGEKLDANSRICPKCGKHVDPKEK